MMNTKVGTLVRSLALAASLAATGLSASAASLQVSPINIEVFAPGAASTVTLSNPGTDVLNAQVRVFRWMQVDGKQKLQPTKDVVASPPALRIKPGKTATVRVVRVVKTPAAKEETYVLLVDEIPPPPQSGRAAVAFAIRHNIPVYFTPPGLESALSWQATSKGGVLKLVAANSGDRRARLTKLAVSGAADTVTVADGLAGYVLAGGSNAWRVNAKKIKVGSKIRITSVGNDGPVEATVQVQAGN